MSSVMHYYPVHQPKMNAYSAPAVKYSNVSSNHLSKPNYKLANLSSLHSLSLNISSCMATITARSQ